MKPAKKKVNEAKNLEVKSKKKRLFGKKNEPIKQELKVKNGFDTFYTKIINKFPRVVLHFLIR